MRIISAAESLAILHYVRAEYQAAAPLFEKTVSLLLDRPELGIAEFYSMLIQAECYQYLAIIALQENEDKMEFYAKTSAQLAGRTADASGNAAAMEIAIVSNCLAAEYYLKKRNKQNAKECAQTGLHYCEELRKVEPQSERLNMEAVLQKLYNKASRRLF